MSEQKLRSRGRPWVKGQSGNPWGRKPGTKTHDTLISEATRRGLEGLVQDGTLTAAEALAHRRIEIGLRGKPGIALNAIQSIEDRMEGKATQQLKITQTLDEDTVRRLVDIGEMLASRGIEVTPENRGKVGPKTSLHANTKLLATSVINAESNSDSGASGAESEGISIQHDDNEVVS